MDQSAANLDALRIDRAPLETRPRRRRGWWKWLILLLLLLGIAWWFLQPKPAVVKTAVARAVAAGDSGRRTLLNASGYVTTRLDATVSSKVTGKVAEILIEEGMKVEKNQVVARLDDSNIRTGLALAEARLSAAREALEEAMPAAALADVQLERLKSVNNPRAISARDTDAAEAEVKMRRASLNRLRAEVEVAARAVDDWNQQLADMVIRAPFAGVVTTKDSQPGEMISPISAGGGFTRTGICTLVDMDSLEIEVDVGESFINRVKSGQPVEATLDAYPDWKIPCKVIAMIPTADKQKATVKVRVAFDRLDSRILPQMGVKVAFLDEEKPEKRGQDGVVIPKAALVNENGEAFVWIAKDGKAVRRAVKAGDADGNSITILSGLAKGDVVVVSPPEKIKDGTPLATGTGN